MRVCPAGHKYYGEVGFSVLPAVLSIKHSAPLIDNGAQKCHIAYDLESSTALAGKDMAGLADRVAGSILRCLELMRSRRKTDEALPAAAHARAFPLWSRGWSR